MDRKTFLQDLWKKVPFYKKRLKLEEDKILEKGIKEGTLEGLALRKRKYIYFPCTIKNRWTFICADQLGDQADGLNVLSAAIGQFTNHKVRGDTWGGGFRAGKQNRHCGNRKENQPRNRSPEEKALLWKVQLSFIFSWKTHLWKDKINF